MPKKARLGLYLDGERMKRQVKVAAAKRGVSVTAYCSEAIKERLIRDGEIAELADENRKVLLTLMDRLRQEIGPIGISAANLVKTGRRR